MPSVISLFTDTGTIVDETNALFVQMDPDSPTLKIDVAAMAGGKDYHGIVQITPGGKTVVALINNDDAIRPVVFARGLTAAWADRLKVVSTPNPAAVVTGQGGIELGSVHPPNTSEPSSAPAVPHASEFADIKISGTSPAGVTGFDLTNYASTIPTINQAGFTAYVAATHSAIVTLLYTAADLVTDLIAAAYAQKAEIDAPALIVGGTAATAPAVAVDWVYATEARAYYRSIVNSLMLARADYIAYGGWNQNPGFGVKPGETKVDALRLQIAELEEEKVFYSALCTALSTGGAATLF